jgi:hypothetical protein
VRLGKNQGDTMSNYQIISQTAHAHLRWKRFDNYQFAAQDTVVPLVIQELTKACTSLPIAFIQQGEGYIPVALLGVKKGQNLFVAPNGGWIGSYIPATYRSYPFALAEAENNQLVLCIDADSGLLDERFEQPFFDDNDEPAQSVKDVLGFLQQLQNSRQLTQRICDSLQTERLVVPWPLTIETGEGKKVIEGLYCIDESKLESLDSDALARLHQAGALSAIYCQLISMQHTQMLRKVADIHTEHGATQEVPENLDSVLDGMDDDDFTFDFD